MRHAAKYAWMLGPVLLLLGGCIVAAPPPTTVELVNSTSLDVRPNLYISGSATDIAGLFVGNNLVTDFTTRAFPELRGGESATLTLECDQIKSVGVDAPVLFDAVTLTPTRSADQIFLLQGTDFECGFGVRFVYFMDGDTFSVRVETQ
jgi:hypothetical protein